MCRIEDEIISLCKSHPKALKTTIKEYAHGNLNATYGGGWVEYEHIELVICRLVANRVIKYEPYKSFTLREENIKMYTVKDEDIGKPAVNNGQVGVLFDSYRPYSFLTDLELDVGDIVVCDTKNGLSIGTVSKDFGSSKPYKWVVCKVDMETHEERMRKEELTKKLKAKIEKRSKDMDEVVKLQRLAGMDPEIRKMYDELSENDPAKYPAFED